MSVTTKFTSKEANIEYCPSKNPGERKKTDFKKKIGPLGLLCTKLILDATWCYHIYPTPPLRQDMTQGQFLSGV